MISMRRNFPLFIILLSNVIHSHQQANYYWKEYDGIIPSDAVPVVDTGSSAVSYLGSAPIEDNGSLLQGLYIGQLFAGEVAINITGRPGSSDYSGYTAKKFVSILCSVNIQNFKWIPRNSNSAFATDEKYLVRGGYEPAYRSPHHLLGMHIARVSETFTHNGNTYRSKVGKVLSEDSVEYGPIYYFENGSEQRTNNFEVLMYGYSQE